jgi:hypothetical protein
MDEAGVRCFYKDDLAYDQWIAQHAGYVLTQPRRGEYMLHDSHQQTREHDRGTWVPKAGSR